MPIRSIPGAPALSAFRLDDLNRRLAPLSARLASVTEVFVVFGAAAGVDDARLAEVLQWSGSAAVDPGLPSRWIAPRLGTRSPWSSKATDILHRCGLAVERVERLLHYAFVSLPADAAALERIEALLHDPMTQSVLRVPSEFPGLHRRPAPAPLQYLASDAASLAEANRRLGMALSDDEIAYLAARFAELGRAATDAELMMFAQANSEHCRHKVFNASWTLDGQPQVSSLFGHIRNTHARTPQGTLVAYKDNAAVLEGHVGARFLADGLGRYRAHVEPIHLCIKVETHNHPTAIAPYAGAATGAGGEIRDEGATGRGARPKAGLTGFTVSHLRFADAAQPWEATRPLPAHLASPLRIMTEGPIGAAAFNNEFGRPALGGYFRTFEHFPHGGGSGYAYDKPIMIAGGLGSVRADDVEKRLLQAGDVVIVLGGPAMLIGLGGGAASSQASGVGSAARDFASVQRDNAEMERRCQEVIDRCIALGVANPIVSIHDVGAGGLSNAIPELLHDSEVGGEIDLGAVLNDDPGMSPMQIWCNEAQERYVLGVRAEDLSRFAALAQRERCLYAAVGRATAEQHLKVTLGSTRVIDLPMDVLFGKAPKMQREGRMHQPQPGAPLDLASIDLNDALLRVLRFPAVASKQFLITIGDRTVGGLSHRDPMVGAWQTPVADVAVTLADFSGYTGEAMAMGERTPLALLNARAAARMAVGEALTNLWAAPVERLEEVKLSANWMAAVGDPDMDGALYAAVEAVGRELCPALGLSIPVGKDSMSMRAQWLAGDGSECRTRAPVSLIVSAFARLADVRVTLTPELKRRTGGSSIWLLDLGARQPRLGGSCLAQVHGVLGDVAPDLDDASAFRCALEWLATEKRSGRILAWHDRSDGGLIVAVLEMAFAARLGLELEIGRESSGASSALQKEQVLRELFNEELGVLVEVDDDDVDALLASAASAGVTASLRRIGAARGDGRLLVTVTGERPDKSGPTKAFAGQSEGAEAAQVVLDADMGELIAAWGETSWRIQRGRDNPVSADQEFQRLRDYAAPGLLLAPSFDVDADIAAPFIASGARPRIAILREQGVNGQLEMAAAFDRAGFEAIDMHVSDLESGRRRLADFRGLAVCGGFSYGDVLGAGQGWAKGIGHHPELAAQFRAFFADPATFTLGVCNGCQMMSGLKDMVPGAAGWPRFLRNHSEQYEARLVQVEILESPSVLLAGMAGSRLPLVVSHGEGRADWGGQPMPASARPALRFIESDGRPAHTYPANPNGSPDGLTGFTTDDGRVLILMPHPERVFRRVQMSWAPGGGEDSPWLRVFRNARLFVG